MTTAQSTLTTLPGMSTRRDARQPEPGPPRASTAIEPQELLVSFFAGLGPIEQPVRTGTLAELLTLFGFTIGSARIAVKRFASRELMERSRQGRYWYATPSSRLRELVAIGDRRMAELATQPRWDGTWTIAWNAMPDELRRERHRLSRRLRFLGFGPLEDSVWIAPGDLGQDVLEFARRLSIDQHVSILSGARSANSAESVVARAWEVDELRQRYDDFVTEFGPELGVGYRGKAAFVVLVRAINTFRRLPYLDPMLPAELFPVAAQRTAACALFDGLKEELSDEAVAFFTEANRSAE